MSSEFNHLILLSLSDEHPRSEVSSDEMLKYLETLIAGDPQTITLSNNQQASLQWESWAERENTAPNVYKAWSELGENSTTEYASLLVMEAVKAARRHFNNKKVGVFCVTATAAKMHQLIQ